MVLNNSTKCNFFPAGKSVGLPEQYEALYREQRRSDDLHEAQAALFNGGTWERDRPHVLLNLQVVLNFLFQDLIDWDECPAAPAFDMERDILLFLSLLGGLDMLKLIYKSTTSHMHPEVEKDDLPLFVPGPLFFGNGGERTIRRAAGGSSRDGRRLAANLPDFEESSSGKQAPSAASRKRPKGNEPETEQVEDDDPEDKVLNSVREGTISIDNFSSMLRRGDFETNMWVNEKKTRHVIDNVLMINLGDEFKNNGYIEDAFFEKNGNWPGWDGTGKGACFFALDAPVGSVGSQVQAVILQRAFRGDKKKLQEYLKAMQAKPDAKQKAGKKRGASGTPPSAEPPAARNRRKRREEARSTVHVQRRSH